MGKHVAWFAVLVGSAGLALGQEVAPFPQPLTPPPVLALSVRCLEAPPAGKRVDLGELQQRLELLKAERQALDVEARAAGPQAGPLTPAASAESMKLRLRLGELLLKLESRGRPPTVPTPSPGPVPPPLPQTGRVAPATPPPVPEKVEKEPPEPAPPLDALALAQALFRAASYEQSLQAFRTINLTGMKAEDRVPVQYMIATCLRKLGKVDEASALYREVANSRGDEQVASCAQWQLTMLRWRREIEARLQEVQQRRQALERGP